MEATIGTQEEKFPIVLCIAGCLAFLDALCKVSVEFSSHMTIRNAPTYFIIVPRAKILRFSLDLMDLISYFPIVWSVIL